MEYKFKEGSGMSGTFLIGYPSSGKLLRVFAWLIICLLSLDAQQTQAQSRELTTVVSEGFGRDVADASLQAARSALTNVVGSFIDANTIIQKRTEIENAVKSQTTKIDRNIREYSQGVIQSFEVVAISESSGLTKVTAKVTVRIEDFRVYIKEVASGSTSVGSGLFAQMQTEAKQSNNASKIFHDNFLQPLTRGEGLQIQVGPPVPFSQTAFANDKNIVRSSFVEKLGPSSIFGFELSISVNNDFWINSERALRSISSSSGKLQGDLRGNIQVPNQLRDEDSLLVLVREPAEHTLEGIQGSERHKALSKKETIFVYYKVDKVRAELRKLSPIGSYFASLPALNSPRFYPNLIVELTDQSGSTIKEFKLDSSNKSVGDILVPRSQNYIATTVPWSVLRGYESTIIGYRDRRFWVLIGVDTDTLRRAAKITAKLTSD